MSPAEVARQLPPGVRLQVFADGAGMAVALAESIAATLREVLARQAVATLVVSGGRSPLALFEALSASPLDWSRVLVGLADERWLPPGDEASNETLVRRHLLRGPAAAARCLGLYRPAANLEQAARLADQALAGLPRIDVLLLGMGNDGHTASLFPGDPGLAQALAEDCACRVVPMRAPQAPCQRLSLTWPVLAAARRQVLLLQGPDKLASLARALAVGTPAQMPIRAFLRAPLEICYCA